MVECIFSKSLYFFIIFYILYTLYLYILYRINRTNNNCDRLSSIANIPEVMESNEKIKLVRNNVDKKLTELENLPNQTFSYKNLN